MLFSQCRQRVLRLLANRQDLALERVLIGRAFAARDDALAHDRHRIDDRLAQTIKADRHFAPAKDGLAFLGDELFKRPDHEIAGSLVLRQEAHSDRIVARLRQGDTGAIGPIAQ